MHVDPSQQNLVTNVFCILRFPFSAIHPLFDRLPASRSCLEGKAVEEADVDEATLLLRIHISTPYHDRFHRELGSTYVGVGVAAVDALARVAVLADGKDVAQQLADDGDGRVAAGHLAVVVTVDAAGLGRGRVAPGGRGHDGGSEEGNSGELHIEKMKGDLVNWKIVVESRRGCECLMMGAIGRLEGTRGCYIYFFSVLVECNAGRLRSWTGSYDGQCVPPMSAYTYRVVVHSAVVNLTARLVGIDRPRTTPLQKQVIRAVALRPSFLSSEWSVASGRGKRRGNAG